MLAEPEHYKGIIYVRISALPGEQKNRIRESYNQESIVKILKDNALINDCILYDDYLTWYKQYKGVPISSPSHHTSTKLLLQERPELIGK
jgi:hypothetical protein